MFAGVGGFDPAVEEKRDVRVLFGLGQPGLLQARCRQNLSPRVRQGLRRDELSETAQPLLDTWAFEGSRQLRDRLVNARDAARLRPPAMRSTPFIARSPQS